MYCGNCGMGLPETELFCFACGNLVTNNTEGVSSGLEGTNYVRREQADAINSKAAQVVHTEM